MTAPLPWRPWPNRRALLREMNGSMVLLGVSVSASSPLHPLDHIPPPTVDQRAAWLADLAIAAPLLSVPLLPDTHPYRRRSTSTVWQFHPDCAHWLDDLFIELIGPPLLGYLCAPCLARHSL